MREPLNVGLWLSLVAKFQDLSDEPTSRKSVVLMQFALLLQVPLSLLGVVLAQARPPKVVDETQLNWWLSTGVLVLLLCLALAWRPASRRAEARWTAYLIVVTYGLWVGGFGLSAGNTIALGWLMFVVILVAVWYDVAVGVVAAVYALSLVGMGVLLTATGVVPYSPITHGRAVSWSDGTDTAGFFFAFGGGFLYAFSMVCLATAARAVQRRELAQAQRLISRYAPAQVIAELASGRGRSLAEPRRTRLTMVFSDIVGFTEAADELDPEVLASVLNEYLSEMATIAHAYDGTIEQFVGDAVMVFFGAPVATTDRDHALRAVRMSLAMQSRLAELHAGWAATGIRVPFQSRIGVNTGHASVGDFGSSDRSVYGAVGLQVNVAARIQAHCKAGTVLISEATWALVHDQIPCKPRGELSLKGVHFPVRVFEVGPE